MDVNLLVLWLRNLDKMLDTNTAEIGIFTDVVLRTLNLTKLMRTNCL